MNPPADDDQDQDPIVKAYVPGAGRQFMRISDATAAGYSTTPPTTPPYNPRWQPGQSGNPAGPPKGHVKLTPVLGRLLEMPAGSLENYQPQTVAEEIALTRLSVANQRSHWGAADRNAVWDRTDGPVSRDTGSVLLEEYAAFQRQVIDAFLHSLNVIDGTDTPGLLDAETGPE